MTRFDTSDAVSPKSGLLVREPIVITNLVSALFLEVCILLRQFGVPLTDGQVDAINAVAGLLLLIAAAVFSRKLTTPLADPRDKVGQRLTPDRPLGMDTAPKAAKHLAGPPLAEDVADELPSKKSDGDDPFGGLRRNP